MLTQNGKDKMVGLCPKCLGELVSLAKPETITMESIDISRVKKAQWRDIVLTNIYRTKGINDAIEHDKAFGKEIVDCLEKYLQMNWGDTCRSDYKLNDNAVAQDDRVLAKYITSKGNIFIITEHDRSATTILFAHEY